MIQPSICTLRLRFIPVMNVVAIPLRLRLVCNPDRLRIGLSDFHLSDKQVEFFHSRLLDHASRNHRTGTRASYVTISEFRAIVDGFGGVSIDDHWIDRVALGAEGGTR